MRYQAEISIRQLERGSRRDLECKYIFGIWWVAVTTDLNEVILEEHRVGDEHKAKDRALGIRNICRSSRPGGLVNRFGKIPKS